MDINWEALFVVLGFVAVLIGIPFAILGYIAKKYFVKHFPFHTLLRKMNAYDIFVAVYPAIIFMSVLLIFINLPPSFLDLRKYGIDFFTYCFFAALIWISLLFTFKKMGLLTPPSNKTGHPD